MQCGTAQYRRRRRQAGSQRLLRLWQGAPAPAPLLCLLCML